MMVSGGVIPNFDSIDVDPDAVIKLYLLESPWPFNAPPDIVRASGNVWNFFAFMHAGIGFSIEASANLYAVEYYGVNYLGSFFPTISNATLTFESEAGLRYYQGFDEKYWTSQWVTSRITGHLFMEAIGFIKEYLISHQVFQPLSVCHWPPDRHTNAVLVNSTSSYDFAFALFDFMASRGVEFSEQLVLPPQATHLCMYTSKNSTDLVKVDDSVVSFYQDTTECINEVARTCVTFENATDQIPGDFMVGVRRCFWDRVGYVKDVNSTDQYYQVQLSGEGLGIHRGVRVIPPRPNPPPVEADSAALSLFVGALIIGGGLLGLILGIRKSLRTGDHVVPFVPHTDGWDMRSPPRSPQGTGRGSQMQLMRAHVNKKAGATSSQLEVSDLSAPLLCHGDGASDGGHEAR